MTLVFTSGQVAKLLRVAQRSVSRWFDEGLLEGYRLPPPGNDRRITRESLARFLLRQGMPPLAKLEAWAEHPETAEEFDRRIQAEAETTGEGMIRASGASACAFCDRPFSGHPPGPPAPDGYPLRRVCNGDLVRL